jgi:hypothetical protein
MAYCLMGLFGVNMPPIYGEGENAFQRLQLEIISKSDDESIFAWVEAGGNSRGLLARSPAAFKYSGEVRQLVTRRESNLYAMSNRGLRMEVELWEPAKPTDFVSTLPNKDPIPPNTYLALLNCRLRGYNRTDHLAINLQRVHGKQFIRLPYRLFSPSWNGPVKWENRYWETVYVWQPDASWYRQAEKQQELQYVFSLQDRSPPGKGFSISERHISCTGNSGWEATADGLRLTLDTSDHGDALFQASFTRRRMLERDTLPDIQNEHS